MAANSTEIWFFFILDPNAMRSPQLLYNSDEIEIGRGKIRNEQCESSIVLHEQDNIV